MWYHLIYNTTVIALAAHFCTKCYGDMVNLMGLKYYILQVSSDVVYHVNGNWIDSEIMYIECMYEAN